MITQLLNVNTGRRMVLLLVLLESLLAVVSESTMIGTQSSTIDGYTADLAVDMDPTTCSQTGFELTPWWKVDLGVVTPIQMIELTGSTVAINVRIGNGNSLLGLRRGFDSSPLCGTVLQLQPSIPLNVTCPLVLYGRYVSIQVANNVISDPQGQMILCNVKFYSQV